MAAPSKLPPLDYFLAFEAAAKAGGFARAAERLNIAESAISRKIKLLEQHYDALLFTRGRRSVELTTLGQELLVSVSSALSILRDASDDLATRSGARLVNLAATNSVAALWLLPKLRQFNRSNKSATIMVMASDDDSACLAPDMDLSILRGEGDWPGFDAHLLFGETVFPVCSREYLRRNPAAGALTEIAECDLIEVASQHDEWMNWKTWLGEATVDHTHTGRAATFNTYPLAVQAAVDGLGVALGWGHLVDHLLAKGDLVRPLGADAAVRTQSGYYLLKRTSARDFPQRQIVENWLLKTSAARRRYAPEPAK